MANNNNPHGLRPLGTNVMGGATVTYPFQKAAADAQAIFRQDVVARQTGGFIGADAIVPGTTLLSGVTLDYGAALTLTNHLVIVDPGAYYEAQSDITGAGATSVTAAQLGQNANLVYAAGSGLPPHLSGTQIAASTVAASAALDVHLIELYPDIQNSFGNYDRIEILINKGRLNGTTAGV